MMRGIKYAVVGVGGVSGVNNRRAANLAAGHYREIGQQRPGVQVKAVKIAVVRAEKYAAEVISDYGNRIGSNRASCLECPVNISAGSVNPVEFAVVAAKEN